MKSKILFIILILFYTLSSGICRAQAINVTTTGVGIGTAAPESRLHIQENGVISPRNLIIDNIVDGGNAAQINLRHAEGTLAAPTAVKKDQALANIAAWGYNGTGWNGPVTWIRTHAAEDFSSTAKGSYLEFATTSNGNNSATERMRIDNNGNIGIGTTNPTAKLQIGYTGTDGAANGIRIGDSNYQYNIYQQSSYTGTISNSLVIDANGDTLYRQGSGTNNGSGNIIFMTGAGTSFGGTGASIIQMRIDGHGNVGIGTVNTIDTYRLAVNGKIRAKGFTTDTSNWADYVLRKDYKLSSLAEVEQHIAEEGHLPGIPSEKEAMAQGIDLGDMQVKLLAQIEQLTLHMIEHEKILKALKQENAQLKLELKAISTSGH